MQVLHAHWLPPLQPDTQAGMLFWSETTKTPPPKQKVDRKKAQKHPFTETGSKVRALLEKLIEYPLDVQYRSLTLWLPTGSFAPQPSPQLIHDWEIDSTPVRLAQWNIRGVWLPATDAFNVLMALSHRDDYPPTVALADECHYWQVVSRMVLEGLAQQKMRPGLEEVAIGEKYEARWHPVLDGPKDSPRLAQLRQAMPPICRADAPDPAQTLPVGVLLDSYLNIMTDTLARQWGAAKQPRLTGGEQAVGQNWVRALFHDEPTIAGASAAIHHAQSSYRAWLRNLYVAGPKEYRITFQLNAPPRANGKWDLSFLLQARDDPSLLVPAKEVWKVRHNTLNTLNRYFKRPQETLLTALGYSARFFEPIQRALQTAKPNQIKLNGQEAYNFLRECTLLLEQSGFGVLVPPWWNKSGARLGMRLKMSSSASAPAAVSSGIVGFDNLVKYRWEISIGEHSLTREEFDALVALKSPLVQVRGQWIQLDSDQIEAAIRFWDRQAEENNIGLLGALQLGLGTEEEAEGLPVEGVEFDGWLDDWVEKFKEQTPDALPSPPGLQATLRPYQEHGYSWLNFMHKWGMGAILADDMGLGKTIQTLSMLQHHKEEQIATAPVLLICPTSVVTNWEKEAKRFTPDLNVMVHQGPKRLRGKAFLQQAEKVDIVLTSYALARREQKALQKIEWYGVVLDEAQNIKNPQTKQAQAIRKLPASFRLALTGTPIENRLSELWSIMQFLNPGYLGSQKNFRQTFILPIEKERDKQATTRLRRMTQPFILRRLKTDSTVIQDLPEKIEQKVYCHLTEEQATLYEAIVHDVLLKVENSEGIERQGLVLSMLMKLKQVCNHPGQFLHQLDNYKPSRRDKRSGKLSRLTEMLAEIVSQDERVLIFTQFAQMGNLLKHYLQTQLGVGTQFLHGGVPGHKRQTLVQRFQEENNGPPIFILSIKAGGTGLNLTRANHVFHFDRWWNPAVEDQATDRAFRIGQKKNVLVHKFVCVGTVEEQIDQMIDSKKSLAESIVGQNEEWLTEMSNDKLRDVVTLRKDKT